MDVQAKDTFELTKAWSYSPYIVKIFHTTTCLILVNLVVPSTIKSEAEKEFESLGSQKVYFYVLQKKSIFQWKRGYLYELKI